MTSKEEESVGFKEPIFPSNYRGNVEQWLLEVELSMKVAVKDLMGEALDSLIKSGNNRTTWLQQWQG